jgi:hypothetical protein
MGWSKKRLGELLAGLAPLGDEGAAAGLHLKITGLEKLTGEVSRSCVGSIAR